MDERCPTCDRRFESITDYPLVKVVKVERLPLSPNASFTVRDNFIFAGPKLKVRNARPPKPVLHFFRDNPKATQ